MQKTLGGKLVLGLAGATLFAAGCVVGQQTATSQKTLMHVFAYTPLQGATPLDYDNFKKATAALAGKVPGLRRDRKSTRLNSSHIQKSRMPSSA